MARHVSSVNPLLPPPSCLPAGFALYAHLRSISTRASCAASQTRHPNELRLGTDIPVGVRPVPLASLPDGCKCLPVLMADCDAVMQMYIDNGMGDRDPYWTEVWPSSVAMAEQIFARPELVRGLRVADLGCGLGLGGLAAGLAGAAEVHFLDREPLALQLALLNSRLCGLWNLEEADTLRSEVNASDALQFAALEAFRSLQAFSCIDVDKDAGRSQSGDSNVMHQVLPSATSLRPSVIEAHIFDWSALFPASLLHTFDVVLACDVLYEAFSVEPVARVGPQLLSKSRGAVRSGGRILLADPPLRAKQNRDQFVELLADQGFMLDESGEKKTKVRDGERAGLKEVDITLMSFRQAAWGDTVGLNKAR